MTCWATSLTSTHEDSYSQGQLNCIWMISGPDWACTSADVFVCRSLPLIRSRTAFQPLCWLAHLVISSCIFASAASTKLCHWSRWISPPAAQFGVAAALGCEGVPPPQASRIWSSDGPPTSAALDAPIRFRNCRRSIPLYLPMGPAGRSVRWLTLVGGGSTCQFATELAPIETSGKVAA